MPSGSLAGAPLAQLAFSSLYPPVSPMAAELLVQKRKSHATGQKQDRLLYMYMYIYIYNIYIYIYIHICVCVFLTCVYQPLNTTPKRNSF